MITRATISTLTDTDLLMSLYELNENHCDLTVISRERDTRYAAQRDMFHVERMVRDMHQLRLTNRELAAAKSADQAAAKAAAAESADEFSRVNLCPILNQVGEPHPAPDADMQMLEASQRLIALFTA